MKTALSAMKLRQGTSAAEIKLRVEILILMDSHIHWM